MAPDNEVRWTSLRFISGIPTGNAIGRILGRGTSGGAAVQGLRFRRHPSATLAEGLEPLIENHRTSAERPHDSGRPNLSEAKRNQPLA